MDVDIIKQFNDLLQAAAAAGVKLPNVAFVPIEPAPVPDAPPVTPTKDPEPAALTELATSAPHVTPAEEPAPKAPTELATFAPHAPPEEETAPVAPTELATSAQPTTPTEEPAPTAPTELEAPAPPVTTTEEPAPTVAVAQPMVAPSEPDAQTVAHAALVVASPTVVPATILGKRNRVLKNSRGSKAFLQAQIAQLKEQVKSLKEERKLSKFQRDITIEYVRIAKYNDEIDSDTESDEDDIIVNTNDDASGGQMMEVHEISDGLRAGRLTLSDLENQPADEVQPVV